MFDNGCEKISKKKRKMSVLPKLWKIYKNIVAITVTTVNSILFSSFHLGSFFRFFFQNNNI